MIHYNLERGEKFLRKYFLLTIVFLFAFFGTSFAEISKITVSEALKRISRIGSFDRPGIKFEKTDTPDVWLENKSTVHVTRGMMKILDNEAEIAGVLAQVIGQSMFRKSETEADQFSSDLLRKTRYNPRALYDALKKLQGKRVNSRQVTPERLANLAGTGVKGASTIGMEDIAEILMGR